MDKITDAIWIGNRFEAADQDGLRAVGIKSILCLDGCMMGKEVPSDIERVEVAELIDGAGNSPQKFLRSVRLLKELSMRHAPVLVHCHAGRSRSAAVVCKYLMQEQGKTLAQAMKEITSKREVSIMPGLQEVLDF